MKFDIAIQVDKRYQRAVDPAWIRRVAEQTLGHQQPPTPLEVSLVVTDDNAVRELNRAYRGIDEPTDVLAFALGEKKSRGKRASFPEYPDGVVHLGEVIISYPTAVTQAAEQGHPVRRELAILVIHGLLHLLGYDHRKRAEEQKMRAVETEVLRQVDEGTALKEC